MENVELEVVNLSLQHGKVVISNTFYALVTVARAASPKLNFILSDVAGHACDMHASRAGT